MCFEEETEYLEVPLKLILIKVTIEKNADSEEGKEVHGQGTCELEFSRSQNFHD